MPELIVTVDRVLSFPDPKGEERPHRLLLSFVEKLDTTTTHVNPAYASAQRQGRRADPAKERIKLLVEEGGKCEVPRGCLPELREAARRFGITITWDPQIVTNVGRRWPLQAVEATTSERTGRPFGFRPEYQPAIIQACLEKRQGVVVLPCGGGKTTSGVGAILASGEAALVLVHTEDLLEQWVDTVRRMAGVDPRVIGAGHHDPRPLQPGEIAVGMVQTIQPNLETYRSMLDSVGFLLVDECHRSPADLFRAVVNACPGRFRIGLSATPNRADGFGFLINALIGPVIYRLPRGAIDLIEWGYLRRPLVIPVASGYSPPDLVREWIVSCPSCSADEKRAKRATQTLATSADKATFSAGRLSCRRSGRSSVKCSHVFTGEEKKELGMLILAQVQSDAAVNRARVETMSTLVQEGVEVGRLALTLVNRKDGVEALTAEHRARGLRVRGVTSEVEDRGAIIAGFRARRYDSMVATQLADEGLDVPSLDLLVMGSAGRHDGTAQQRAGRTCRPVGHEVPLVFDVVDDYPAARSQWRDRASAYVEAYGAECLPTDRAMPLGWAIRVIQRLEEPGGLAEVTGQLARFRG